MATPTLDLANLADNVQVAAGTDVTSGRVTLSPTRKMIQLSIVGLTVAGAAVAGGQFILQQLVQSATTTALTRQNWYEIGVIDVPPDGTAVRPVFYLLSLGSGIDVNAGTTIRGQMRASAAADVYFTVVAIDGS